MLLMRTSDQLLQSLSRPASTVAQAAAPGITAAGNGRVLRAFGTEITVLLDGRQTDGRLTMFTNVSPPGQGAPPHYHEAEDEWFHVLEGEAEFFAQGRWQRAQAGVAVFVPRGAVHGFRNAGIAPLRLLITVSPAGFEEWFARCAEEFARPDGPRTERIADLTAQQRMHFVKE